MSMVIYIVVMAVVTYLIRMIPFVLFRKKIKSKFLKSVFYYLPYAILASMTFPSIFYATGNVISSSIATIAALIMAYFELPMYVVAIGTSIIALIIGFII